MKTKTDKSYLVSARLFLKAVIRHRRMIIAKGRNEINPAKCFYIIDHIERHMHAGILKTARSIAAYIINHADDIRYLIRSGDPKSNQFENEILPKSHVYKYL